MVVTVKQLRKLKACYDQFRLFQSIFGESVEVTEENCIKAAKAGIDFVWASQNLLSRTRRAAYEEAEAQLWAAYKEARAIAFYKSTLL